MLEMGGQDDFDIPYRCALGYSKGMKMSPTLRLWLGYLLGSVLLAIYGGRV